VHQALIPPKTRTNQDKIVSSKNKDTFQTMADFYTANTTAKNIPNNLNSSNRTWKFVTVVFVM